MKEEKIKPDGKVYLVYCKNCGHSFFDSFDEELAKDKNWDTFFIYPFCKSKLLVV